MASGNQQKEVGFDSILSTGRQSLESSVIQNSRYQRRKPKLEQNKLDLALRKID